jgi:hypothetical protein
MSWKETLSFSPKAYPSVIRGREIDFYPITARLLFQMKAIGKDITRPLAVLFTRDTNDAGRTIKEFENKNTKDVMQETHIEPVSEALATFRIRERQRAIVEIVDTFLSADNKLIVGKLILNSMRQDKDAKDDEVTTLMDGLDVIALRELLTGVYHANKEVLGPLGERVSLMAQEALKRMPEEKESEKEPTQSPSNQDGKPSPELYQPASEMGTDSITS